MLASAAHTKPDLLLAGATGLIGRELLAQARQRGWRVTALMRRPPQTVRKADAQVDWRVVDFAHLTKACALPAARWACCALGTTIKVAGSREAFRAVDFDAVMSFAHAARGAGVARLAVVSALGADARSANFYSRTKGEVEAALGELGFEQLVIARPSLLAGDRASLGQAERPAERLALALTAPIKGLIPQAWRPIEAAVVARAMLAALVSGGSGTTVLDSAALQRMGRG